MRITAGAIGIVDSSYLSASAHHAAVGEGVPTDPIEIIINMHDDMQVNTMYTDGNFYNVIFPDHYIGTRGDTATDPFKDLRIASPTGKIDYPVDTTIVLNIPEGMSIGGNTSGSYGNNDLGSWSGHPAWPGTVGVMYELRTHWVPGWAPGTLNYVTDPSLVINLNTDQWDSSIFTHLTITVNNYGNTIGGGGQGGWGGSDASGPSKYWGGGGGGGGMGLHPAVSTTPDPENEQSDYYSQGEFLAGFGGEGQRLGTSGGHGANGAPGTINEPGIGGVGAGASGGSSRSPIAGFAGGTAVYVQSNTYSETPITGTTINIINGTTGRMYGGGGGGGGARSGLASDNGGTGADMTVQGTASQGGGSNPGQGGWQGSILWVNSANLVVTNTITNDSATSIVGWDGIWA